METQGMKIDELEMLLVLKKYKQGILSDKEAIQKIVNRVL